MGSCLVGAVGALFSLVELKKGLLGSGRGEGPRRKPLFNTSVGKNVISSGTFLLLLHLLLGKFRVWVF